MRKLLPVLFLFCVVSALAQDTTATGTVIDSATQKPLAYVTVSLQSRSNHTLVKSVLTNAKGNFKLPGGQDYDMVISHVGYESKTLPFPVAGDAGTIALGTAKNELANVTVTASRPLVKQEIDRLSYDVQADPQAKGQTVMDMLRRVPLLTVDGDDNIQLQGSGNYRIFINGKPSALVTNNPKDVLRGMQASQILRIEVITTPPAKYDAEGLAGIINIIMVKKVADGYNGTVNVRNNNVYGPGIGFSGTAKQNKFGMSAYGGGGMRFNVVQDIDNQRKNFGTTPDILSQHAVATNDGSYMYVGGEMSAEFDSLHLLTGSVNYALGNNDNRNDRLTNYYVPNGAMLQSYRLLTTGTSNYAFLDIGANYQLGFAHKKDRLLTGSYRYSYSLNGQQSDFTAADRFKYDQLDNTQQNDAGYREHTFQLDYVHPINKLTIEAGGKTILRNNYSYAGGQVYNLSTGTYTDDPSRTNNFNYRQDVYSFYNSYALKLTNLTIQGGLRGEFTSVNADFTSTATKLVMHYSNFIPTLSILKPLKNNNSISFGITNRLMRPGIYQLNPFVDRSNPQLVSSGNPDLRPVISHLFELSYNRVGKGNLNVRLSYMYMNNSIESVTRVIADTLSQTTYDNVGQSKTARLNINGNYPIGPKFSVNFNTGVFYVWIRGTYNGRFYSNEGPRTNTFASATYKVNSMWQLGASGGYNRRYINLQGSSNDYYYTTFSVTCNVSKFTIYGAVNNPFMTYYPFTMYTSTPDFYQSNTSNSPYRTFNINVSYKFGKLNSSIRKNKRGINNDDTQSASN